MFCPRVPCQGSQSFALKGPNCGVHRTLLRSGFLNSKRLRCTRHEDEMLWHNVERAVQCANAGIDGQDKIDTDPFSFGSQTATKKRKRKIPIPLTHEKSARAVVIVQVPSVIVEKSLLARS